MHAVHVHSALAIKRQRKQRTFSSGSNRSKRRPRTSSMSESSLESYVEQEPTRANKVMGTITMLHIGTIFTLIGVLLGLATLLTKQSPGEMAELIGTGIICLVIGLFLILLNRIYAKRDDENLEAYVESRLGRTKEGERLADGAVEDV